MLFGTRKPAAYWYLGAEALAVAVVRPTDHEPELLSCWGIEAGPGPGPFACGVAEAVEAVGAAALRHVVAVDRRYTRLLGEVDALALAADATTVAVAVEGRPDLTVVAERAALDHVVRVFARVGLRLADVDAEDCALASLATALGGDGRCGDIADVRADRSRHDALSAVSVDKVAEEQAVRIAGLLAVPIGLAVSRLSDGGDVDEV